MQTISILGCGWLGLPLARHLARLGYTVKGSTTTRSKIPVLKSSNIIPYQLTCGKSLEGDDVADFFKCDVLFVNIPFSRDLVDPRFYGQQMRAVVKQSVESGIRRVIMASSTSIYPRSHDVAKEDELFEPEDNRSAALLESENIFLKEPQLKVTVIRFAGLYGPGREIGSFLKTGRVSVKDGNALVNLIHLQDCLGILTAVLKEGLSGEIINACSDRHPRRKDLYEAASRKMGLSVPLFDNNATGGGKVVDNSKVKRLLGYRFIYPDPLEAIHLSQDIDSEP